jgi:hypothetical protein
MSSVEVSEGWSSELRRWSWVGGVVFALATLGGLFMLGTPESDAADSEWVEYFSDSGNRAQVMGTAYLWVVASLGFLLFAWGLSERFRPGDRALASFMLLPATVFAVALGVAGIAVASVAGAVEFGDSPVPSGELSRMLEQLGIATLLIPGMLSAAVFAALVGFGATREGGMPRWIGVSAFVCAVLLLFSPLFFPAAAMLVWVLAVSVHQATSAR